MLLRDLQIAKNLRTNNRVNGLNAMVNPLWKVFQRYVNEGISLAESFTLID